MMNKRSLFFLLTLSSPTSKLSVLTRGLFGYLDNRIRMFTPPILIRHLLTHGLGRCGMVTINNIPPELLERILLLSFPSFRPLDPSDSSPLEDPFGYFERQEIYDYPFEARDPRRAFIGTCRHWRHTVINSPSMWTFLFLPARMKLETIDKILRRSGNLSLEIRLRVGASGPQ